MSKAADPVAERARCWKYPDDEALPVAEHVTFPAQSLIIAANPDDQKLPWAVILEDRREMYDIAELSFSGDAIGKTDWSADNYWYPRMWIEISGVLTIIGRKARIEPLRRLGASGVDVEGLARDLGHMANQVYRANWETRGQWEQYIVEPFAAEIRKHIAQPATLCDKPRIPGPADIPCCLPRGHEGFCRPDYKHETRKAEPAAGQGAERDWLNENRVKFLTGELVYPYGHSKEQIEYLDEAAMLKAYAAHVIKGLEVERNAAVANLRNRQKHDKAQMEERHALAERAEAAEARNVELMGEMERAQAKLERLGAV